MREVCGVLHIHSTNASRSSQRNTALEHTLSIHQLIGIHLCYIDFNQAVASTKHISHVGDVVFLEAAQVHIFQLFTPLEKTLSIDTVFQIPSICLDTIQVRTAKEHLGNISDILHLQISAVNSLQIGAILEHCLSGQHSVSIKLACVNICDSRTTIKHMRHINSLSCIPVCKLNRCQSIQTREHIGAILVCHQVRTVRSGHKDCAINEPSQNFLILSCRYVIYLYPIRSVISTKANSLNSRTICSCFNDRVE